jgi:hypothetical protein
MLIWIYLCNKVEQFKVPLKRDKKKAIGIVGGLGPYTAVKINQS